MKIGNWPPGPRRYYPGSHFVGLRRTPIEFLTKVRSFGELSHFTIGSLHFFLLSNPDHIKDVLVTHHQNFHKSLGLQKAKRLLGEGLLTSEGAFHMRQRRLAQPAFHPQRVLAYAPLMTQAALKIQENWQDGMTVDMAEEMKRLALVIAGRTLFGADVESEAEMVSQALTDSMRLFSVVMLPFIEFLERLPFPAVRRFQKAKASLDATIYRIIEERRKRASTNDSGDLLSMLLLAQDTEGDGGRMSDLQLRDEVMTIFLAGHETTANALTWTWYLLSQNPEAEARLHGELEQVLDGRIPVGADLPRLPYTEMVFAESMRLYPPAWMIGRRALSDYRIGEYTLPAKSILLMSQYLMQRDERFFPDPLKFDPDRWSEAARKSRPKFCYFPFGGGPRVCIGEFFAGMEGVLLIATLAQRWRMRLAPDQRVEPQPLVTLRSKHGMRMRLEKRGASA